MAWHRVASLRQRNRRFSHGEPEFGDAAHLAVTRRMRRQVPGGDHRDECAGEQWDPKPTGLIAAIIVLLTNGAPPESCSIQQFPNVVVSDGTFIAEDASAASDETDSPSADGAAPPILP